jgi:hypothetical protein
LDQEYDKIKLEMRGKSLPQVEDTKLTIAHVVKIYVQYTTRKMF